MANELPEGFVLDSQPQDLPQGFTLDQQPALREGQAATPVEQDFIPTEENLAIQPPQQEDSAIDRAIGSAEAAAAAVTGATTGALGFVAGGLEGAVGELTGRLKEGEGLQEAKDLASALTFQPRTKAGQDIIKGFGEALSVLPPVLGTTPVSTLRAAIPGKQVTGKILANSRAKKQLLVDEIKSGNPNIDLIGKALNESGDIITRPASKRAVKTLGGDTNAQGIVSVIESMSPSSKSQFNKMLDIVEKGNKNPLFRDANRASDVLGQSIANRARSISKLNKKASNDIGNTARSLNDINVDIKAPSNEFFNSLSELGVTFNRADDGWVTPDFSRSTFVGGSQKDMTVLINELMNGTPNFEKAHKLKRSIRDNVNFDKGGSGQLSQASEKLLKDLSSGIDGILDSTSPKYKKANESFAKTIKLKDDLDKLAGKDIDLEGALSPSALGGKAMRLISNAESRVPIKQALQNTDKVLKEFGITFKDDVPSLVHLSGALNDIFKLAPSGSLKGNVISAGVEVADALVSPVSTARAAGSKLKQITAPDFNKKIRALRSISANPTSGSK